jgi:predicted nucleic acid-binding protein
MSTGVLFDTCALYPAHLRDTLLRLAERGLFRPLWSPDILEELRRNLVEAGLAATAVERTIGLMNRHIEDAQTTGCETLVGAMECDVKDRHVLAAAVHSHADTLVTFNIKDFPPQSLAPYSVALTTPEDFLLDLLDLAPRLVVVTLQEQAASHKREPKTLSGLLTVLARSGVPGFADEVWRLVN